MVEEVIQKQEQRRYDNRNRKTPGTTRTIPLIRTAFQVTSSVTDLRQPETYRFRSQINPHYNKEGGDKLTNINKMSCYDLVIYTIDNPLLSVYDLYHNKVRCTQLKIKKDEDKNECERRNESSDHKEVRRA